MKILMAHNYYRHRGGEGISFRQDVELLEAHGHQVIRWTRDNRNVGAESLSSRLGLAAQTVWSKESYAELKELLGNYRPDLVHFQNTFPLISPSAYYACREARVPVVQNLRNYRLMCANVLFRRDGRVCEDCLGKSVPWPAVAHACYRDSRSASAVVAAMLSVHRGLNTWRDKVDRYVCLTEFGRRKFISGGLPPDKLDVRPNYVHPDPGLGEQRMDEVLFVGRLSEEKGVRPLIEVWGRLPSIPLRVVGDGPLEGELVEMVRAAGLGQVEMAGRLPHSQVLDALKSCRFVVIPSLWYEGFNRVLVEAFACGTPVIVPSLGSFEEIVDHQETGLMFGAEDSDDLAAKVKWAWDHRKDMAEMGRRGRRAYEGKYTAERNYRTLMEIYGRAIESAS